MNIQDALKETGKVKNENWPEHWIYVCIIDNRFCLQGTLREDTEHYAAGDLIDNNWQPYHPKEEIRPSEAGELWDIKGMKCFTARLGPDLELINEFGVSLILENTIHGKYGCTRLYPPVNDEEVIVIKGVRWEIFTNSQKEACIYPKSADLSFLRFIDKPPMTITLTIPKENS